LRAKNTATTEDEYLFVIRGKTAELFAAACESVRRWARVPRRAVGLPILRHESRHCVPAGRRCARLWRQAAKLGKNVGDDFREGKITLPVVLSFRRGSESERTFWRRALEDGDATETDLEHAIGLMAKHRALETRSSARAIMGRSPRMRWRCSGFAHEGGARRSGGVLHRTLELGRATPPVGWASCSSDPAFLSPWPSPQHDRVRGSANLSHRPVKMIVPYPPGGPIDTMARLLGQQLSLRFGQRWSSTIIRTPARCSAPRRRGRGADGYTRCSLVGLARGFAGVYSNYDLDIIKAFVPVGAVALLPHVLVIAHRSRRRRFRNSSPMQGQSGQVELRASIGRPLTCSARCS